MTNLSDLIRRKGLNYGDVETKTLHLPEVTVCLTPLFVYYMCSISYVKLLNTKEYFN